MIKSIKKNLIVLGLGILAILALVVTITPAKAHAQYEDDGYDHFLARSENPIPGVGSITPNSVKYQSNISNITIAGRGFLPNSVAKFNGSTRPSTYIDYNHMIVHLSAEDLRSPNGGYINVFNPNRGAYSNAIMLKVTGYVAPSTTNNVNNNTNYNSNNSSSNNYNNNSSYSNNNNNGSNGSNGNYSNSQTQNSNGYDNNNGSNGNNGGNTGGDVSSLASNAIFGTNSFSPSGIIQWVLFAIIILLIVIIVRKFFGGEARYHETPLKHA